jgi:prevent-host-death family protein
MRHRVSIYEAKTNFSKYVAKVNDGDEVIVTNRGVDVARLLPPEPLGTVKFGVYKEVWPKWDPEELDEDFARLFDGGQS